MAGLAIIPLFAMNMLLAAQLAAGMERRAVKASVVGLIVLAAVDLAAIPAFGIAGAALGVALSCTALCLLLYRGLRSAGDLRPGRAAAAALKSALPAFGVMLAARALLGEGIPAGLAALAAGLAGGAAAFLPRFRESPYCGP
jgi:peptidoglycan biosynthesis protein MviN/MurJ (putative lipid II flippase)